MRSILFHHSLSTSNRPTHLHGRQSCDKLTIAGQTTQSNGLHHTHVVSLPSPHVLTINSFHFMSHHLLIPSQTRLNPHNNCYSKLMRLPHFTNPIHHAILTSYSTTSVSSSTTAHRRLNMRASTSQTHSQTLPLPYFTITNTFPHINSPPSRFTPTTVTTPSNTHRHFATHIHAAKQCAHTPVGS
jgi:hypothetical protein